MKFDIVRAWKDENYRQSLSEEDLKTLPTNPAGELDENELNAVFGGQDGYGPFGEDVGIGASSSSSSAFRHSVVRVHSWSVLCDISVFSADVHVLGGLDRLINIGNCETRPCLEDH